MRMIVGYMAINTQANEMKDMICKNKFKFIFGIRYCTQWRQMQNTSGFIWFVIHTSRQITVFFLLRSQMNID